jgi:DNA polymerase III subunit delta'
MNHNWQIAGHKKQRDFLSKSIEEQSLPHGMIFGGPEHVGKLAVAKNFARILLCENSSACHECAHCKSFSSQANPDYIELSFTETIKIEQIRNLAYQLNLKPYAAKYKVAVIDNAQGMTLEASNALLKFLEEPKPYTIIILITSNPYSLLATIASRAQKISFGLVADNDYENLIDEKTGSEERQLVLSLAAGRPGLAFSLSRNPESLLRVREFAREYCEFLQADLAQRLILAQRLSDYETPELKEALQFWLLNLEDELKRNPKQDVAKKISSILKARNLLDTNVNPKLLLANMMINS